MQIHFTVQLWGTSLLWNQKRGFTDVEKNMWFGSSQTLFTFTGCCCWFAPRQQSKWRCGSGVIRMFLFICACLSSSDKLTNQLRVSVWRIISLFSIRIAGLQILPFHFAACLLPSASPNSSVNPAFFPLCLRATTRPPPPAFEGVNPTGEFNAFLMNQRRMESGD